MGKISQERKNFIHAQRSVTEIDLTYEEVAYLISKLIDSKVVQEGENYETYANILSMLSLVASQFDKDHVEPHNIKKERAIKAVADKK